MNKHQADFLPDAWENYTKEELINFAFLLAKRGTHRLNITKANKDFEDARNYITFLQKKHTQDLDLILRVKISQEALDRDAGVRDARKKIHETITKTEQELRERDILFQGDRYRVGPFSEGENGG